MELLTNYLEQWLWPADRRRFDPAPRWLTVARYAYALLRDLMLGDLSLRAMSLVYTTMLAIVPLLAFSFSLLKGLGLHRDLAPLLDRFFAPLGPRSGELTQRIIEFVDNVSGSALLGVSILLLIWSALVMAQKVEGSFNFVWRVDRPRSFARRLSEYLSVMLIMPLLMSVAMGFTASLASETVMTRLQQMGTIGGWLASLSSLAPYLMVIALFSFLYVFVPNTRVHFKAAVCGGLFAGMLWAGSGSVFTSVVVSLSRYEAIYSGFAIVIVAMIWLYLSWLILLLGTQLAFYLQNPDYLRLGQRTEVMSNGLRERLALSAMLLIGRDFEQPGHGWRVESLAARIRIARHLLEPVTASLMRTGLITQTKDQRLMPARDPRRISVCDILDAVRNADRDPHHAPGGDWNATVHELHERVEGAIRESLGARSLSDIVDQDARAESAIAAAASAAAADAAAAADGRPGPDTVAKPEVTAPPAGPRVISRR
jgi:membrane protein